MLLVKKANCERVISEEKLKEYLELGYSLIDKKGTILQKGKAQTKDDLRVAFNEATAENAALKKENEALKAENAKIKAEFEKLSSGAGAGNGDIFKCPYCDKEYKSQETLDKHIKEKHPDKLDGAGAQPE